MTNILLCRPWYMPESKCVNKKQTEYWRGNLSLDLQFTTPVSTAVSTGWIKYNKYSQIAAENKESKIIWGANVQKDHPTQMRKSD